MANYMGDVFSLFNNYISELEGYRENKQINDEDYAPTSTANKNYFLEFVKKTAETYSNNTEGASIYLNLKVVYQFPRKNDYATNAHDMWNDIDELERALLDYSNDTDYYLFIEGVEIETLTEDYRLATFAGRIDYTRDLTYG